jgi:hypothetical protein
MTTNIDESDHFSYIHEPNCPEESMMYNGRRKMCI